MTELPPPEHGSQIDPDLRTRCEQLRKLFAERERLLSALLSIQSPQPDDAAATLVADCEARTLAAAHGLLGAPVCSPGDLYAKYSTILLCQEVYLERAALSETLLQQVRDDARDILNSRTQRA